ncbi:KamA family radical SAM protein [Anaeromyxobacter oryzae]|uniref:L-lysine 2,3-aminomutase n=1 Tax=Anaeromyxobacter oryzae TaxID=2918170 RepID=A0ABM7WQT3_9BACT|nr:KamA family radical SAM protein [Anaeromyxobacter oryzae]BDG01823.1 L-lysine 2,3-aminomutase [Anaeromyxobacter oryzae]
MIPKATFPHATDAEWRDWRWQQRHALTSAEALGRVVPLTDAERRGLALAEGRSRIAVTPYYASLMDPDHPSCPVRMQVIPAPGEATLAFGDLEDPIGEEPHRPARAIVHKYRDRALFLAVDRCAVYCRHCTRRRITFGEDGAFDRAAVDEGIAYVRAHPEVRDVIVSGGDPLVLSDDRLEAILAGLRAIPHVQVLRVATRAPVTCPMRITDDLAAMLRRFAPLFLVTHFNHPKECTPEAREACERLVDHGVPVENQTVLLRGVNSSARILGDLFERLLTFRVRPYYLHQGDLAAGTSHLRTPLEAGVEILERLRGRTSGLAIPHLAVDLPGGGGKVTLQPTYLLGEGEQGGRGHWLRNHRGERYFYPEPPGRDCTCPYEEVYYGGADGALDGARADGRAAPEGET